MKSQCAKAKISDDSKTSFLMLHCNRPQIGTTSFISLEDLQKNKEEFDMEDFRGLYAFGGVDLSKTTDLTGAVIIMDNPKDNKLYIHT